MRNAFFVRRKFIILRLLSLFTGIGAFEKALERLNIDYELVRFFRNRQICCKKLLCNT